MKPWLRWTLVILGAAVVDVAARFAMPFDLRRVLIAEALLFPATGVVLARMTVARPARAGWRRTLQWVLVAAFVLAGLRSALWVIGVPVMTANYTLIGLAAALWGIARYRRRRGARRSAAESPRGDGAP